MMPLIGRLVLSFHYRPLNKIEFMRRLIIFLLLLLLVVLVIGWYVEGDLSFGEETAVIPPVCEIQQPLITTQCTIKIGIINTFSRDNSCFSGGTEHKRGYELALNEINSLGGINGCLIELVQIDDKGNDSAATAAVASLASQDIPLIIGAYSSGATLIAAKEADRQNIPFIIPSASSELITSLGYEWVFRINADSAAYVTQALALTATLNDLPRIAVIFENTVFGESAAVAVTAQAEELGISVVAYESYQPGTQSLVLPLSNIRAARPDAVYLVSNNVQDSINLLKTSRDLRIQPQLFIGIAGAFVSPDFVEKAGADAEYVIVTAQWAEDVAWKYEDGMDAAAFADLFRQTYAGAQPGMRSVQTYTSLMLAKQAIEQAQATPNCTGSTIQLRFCVQDQLSQIDLEQTLFGAIKFDETGQNSHPVLMVQIVPDVDGYRFATVYPEQFRTQELILPNSSTTP